MPAGKAGTLIPSWNTGYPLRVGPRADATSGEIVRPGQKLLVLEETDGYLKVAQEADGFEGWIPVHLVAPWPG